MWKAREKCNTVRKWTLYQEFTSPASLWHNHTIHQIIKVDKRNKTYLSVLIAPLYLI
jgi:hypothetical protein